MFGGRRAYLDGPILSKQSRRQSRRASHLGSDNSIAGPNKQLGRQPPGRRLISLAGRVDYDHAIADYGHRRRRRRRRRRAATGSLLGAPLIFLKSCQPINI